VHGSLRAQNDIPAARESAVPQQRQ